MKNNSLWMLEWPPFSPQLVMNLDITNSKNSGVSMFNLHITFAYKMQLFDSVFIALYGVFGTFTSSGSVPYFPSYYIIETIRTILHLLMALCFKFSMYVEWIYNYNTIKICHPSKHSNTEHEGKGRQHRR